MTVRYAALTDAGRVRSHNEDAVGTPAEASGTDDRAYLFAVADGMGGHDAGEVASGIAVRTLFEAFEGAAAPPPDALLAATRAANAAVYLAGSEALQSQGASAAEAHRMGTTLVACVVVADRVFGVSVGDSRTYLLRDDQLTLFTHDQTLAAEYVGRGLLTGEQAKTSPFRSVLLQCLGHSLALKPERFEAALSRGDRLLLCSDGLHGVVDDETLRRLLGQGSAETAAASLIDAANAAGGPDNISVIVVEPL